VGLWVATDQVYPEGVPQSAFGMLVPAQLARPVNQAQAPKASSGTAKSLTRAQPTQSQQGPRHPNSASQAQLVCLASAHWKELLSRGALGATDWLQVSSDGGLWAGGV
jgi:hypothetical protein